MLTKETTGREALSLFCQRKITAEQLKDHCGELLTARGYVKHPVFGWMTHTEMTEAGITTQATGIPCVEGIERVTLKKGRGYETLEKKVTKATPQFERFLARRKARDANMQRIMQDVDSSVEDRELMTATLDVFDGEIS